jgi:1-acyl-sn-glycerol-3-phosphate acyltransferase
VRRKGGRTFRRALTIALYAFAWLLLTATLPVWTIVGILVGAVRQRHFILLRLLFFGWFYFGFELFALMLIGWVFVTRRPGESRDDALYELQAWWASVNLCVAKGLLRLRIEVQGAEVVTPGPVILLIRHASILDTLLPCAYVQRPQRFRVRYVLKQELLADPCIDIVGSALPNYFVDRTGNRIAELEGIRSLVLDLGSDGVLIFPEGTRFSRAKRERVLENLESQGSPLAALGREMTCVLPPKPGGVLTLLDALPDADCVFFAHTGLESFAKIENLINGAIVGSTVRVKLWRVPRDEVPAERDQRLDWLFQQWAEVDSFVRHALETSRATGG